MWSSKVAALVVVIAATWSCGSNPLRIELLEVSGFSDNVPVWMAMRLKLALQNTGTRTITVRGVRVDPDFQDFNEAYAMATPPDLPTAVDIEPGATRTYDAAVTLLNAQQLQPGTHPLVLKVRLETRDGDVTADFERLFDQSADPTRRRLRTVN